MAVGLTARSLASRKVTLDLRTENISKFVKKHGVNFQNPGTKDTLLTTACRDNLLARVEEILKQKPDVNLSNSWKVTPLHFACLNANIAMARKLIDAGANPIAKNAAGFRPDQVTDAQDSAFLVRYARLHQKGSAPFLE